MFNRQLTDILDKAVGQFPVVVVTGARQAGKTTLLRSKYPDYRYLSLETPSILYTVKEDPEGFFSNTDEKFIIVEAQRYPELFSYIQAWVDEKKLPGRFILSGSQNFLLLDQVSQTLAGRAAILQLYPLSYQEYCTGPDEKIKSLWHFLYHGSYPAPYHEKLDTTLWYQSYIDTYIERDVRSIINVRDLSTFRLFLRLCAGFHGCLLVKNKLAQACGISITTVDNWLSLLEASYIVYTLPPYYKNVKKRLVKTPKLYFYDTALVCQLVGIASPDHLKIHSMRGEIFEGFVISEVIKRYASLGKRAPVYFWRDHAGNEIDLLIESADKCIAVEIKSGMTFSSDFFKSLLAWRKWVGSFSAGEVLVYGGEKATQFKGIQVVPWNKDYLNQFSILG